MPEQVEIFADAAEVAVATADRVEAVLRDASARGCECAIALSGGSTPALLFDELARRTAGGAQIPWGCARIFWGDERAVPPDHEDSNYRMARDRLLDPIGLAGDRIHRMPAERADRDEAAREYGRLLAEHLPASDGDPSWPVFDLILLGMGPDGHTASLFPNTQALEAESEIVSANYVPKFDVWRMTLTVPVLNAAREVVLMVSGESKAERIGDILGGRVPADSFPVQQIHPAGGDLRWMIDRAAAADLPMA